MTTYSLSKPEELALVFGVKEATGGEGVLVEVAESVDGGVSG